MKAEKLRKLEAVGWRVGDASDFLGLSSSEAEFVEIKLALARKLRQLREKHHWTQAELAKRVGSSQSRVAKMEAGDATVSVDLLVKSLLAAGADRHELGRVVSSGNR
jgi:DNA-binding XRE family transcriptional regulator